MVNAHATGNQIVTIGSRFGDWQVTWLGGWTRDRLSYIVMVVRMRVAQYFFTGCNWALRVWRHHFGVAYFDLQ